MATKRLIDLDVAIEKAKASDKIVGSSIWETGEVVDFLEDCPIEDAVEVVHGRWFWTETGEQDYEQFWVCSKCGDHTYFLTNYCPNCGAKMDGDGNG